MTLSCTQPPTRPPRRPNAVCQGLVGDDAFRLLPGEEGDHTVFVVDFYDRCKVFGYTKEPVFYRATPLATNLNGWGKHFRRATRPVRPLRDPVHQIRPHRPAGRAAPGHACGRSAAKHPRPRQCRPDAQLLAIQPHRARPLTTCLAELNPMRATSHHRSTRRQLPPLHTPRTPERGFP